MSSATNKEHQELLDVLRMSHIDDEGTIYWVPGRSDCLWKEYSSGLKLYYPGRTDRLKIENKYGTKVLWTHPILTLNRR